MPSKRSKAAKKGWAIRRARELKRRLAALKGWATRRSKKTPSKSSKTPPKKKSPKSPKGQLSRSETKLFEQLAKNLIEQVFLRRTRFFPEARRRTLRIGTRLMTTETLVMASKMTKAQMRAAAGNKAYENEDGYNPFWYHG